MAIGTLGTIDKIADILLISLMLLQEISGKSRAEVLESIKDEGIKTDELINKLR